jgi:hypothetical protein
MPTTTSSNPRREIRRVLRHDIRQRTPRTLHVVPVHTPTGRRSHHLSCVHTRITTVNWLENYGGTQDAALDPATDRVADVFPDEAAIAAAGWASQEASDLLAVLGPRLVGVPANRIPAYLKRLAGRRFSEWQAEVDAERATRQGRRHLRLVVDNTRPAAGPGAADRAPAQVDQPRAA